MNQTKKQSLIESITQTIIGMIVSLCIQLVIYDVLNIKVTFTQNLIITFVFLVSSILRGYIIRRIFNNKKI
jgi:high-affinity Fe2+/Pb2+ permease